MEPYCPGSIDNVNSTAFTMQLDHTGGDNEKITEGLTSDLIGARVVTTMYVNDQPQTAVELVEGVRKHRWDMHAVSRPGFGCAILT
jgi:hypothetical protein